MVSMRRLLALPAAALLLTALSACGGDANDDEKADNRTSSDDTAHTEDAFEPLADEVYREAYVTASNLIMDNHGATRAVNADILNERLGDFDEARWVHHSHPDGASSTRPSFCIVTATGVSIATDQDQDEETYDALDVAYNDRRLARRVYLADARVAECATDEDTATAVAGIAENKWVKGPEIMGTTPTRPDEATTGVFADVRTFAAAMKSHLDAEGSYPDDLAAAEAWVEQQGTDYKAPQFYAWAYEMDDVIDPQFAACVGDASSAQWYRLSAEGVVRSGKTSAATMESDCTSNF